MMVHLRARARPYHLRAMSSKTMENTSETTAPATTSPICSSICHPHFRHIRRQSQWRYGDREPERDANLDHTTIRVLRNPPHLRFPRGNLRGCSRRIAFRGEDLRLIERHAL